MTSTRDILTIEAGALFQQKGYDGTGIAEILQRANLPKGSLYHHFPNGKSDLAIAAARMASGFTLDIINEAFAEARDFEDGATTLCHRLAKLFDIRHGQVGCPVSAILFAGTGTDSFDALLQEIFASWMATIEQHARRLGQSEPRATDHAKRLFLCIQGGWTLARATQSSDVLRDIPALIFGNAT